VEKVEIVAHFSPAARAIIADGRVEDRRIDMAEA
jgi:hypothetical protein